MPEGDWVEVNADGTMEEVQAEVRRRVEEVRASAKLDKPVQRLWEDELVFGP